MRKEAWISQIQEWGLEWGTPKMGNFIGKMMINPEDIVFEEPPFLYKPKLDNKPMTVAV